jgi:hypothetical protein
VPSSEAAECASQAAAGLWWVAGCAVVYLGIKGHLAALRLMRVINPLVRGPLMTVPNSSPRAFAGTGIIPAKVSILWSCVRVSFRLTVCVCPAGVR